jgi:translation initiation factor 6 (eIF-6)
MVYNNKIHLIVQNKQNEIDEFLKPYKTEINGITNIIIPNESIAMKYEELQKELRKITDEIRLIYLN